LRQGVVGHSSVFAIRFPDLHRRIRIASICTSSKAMESGSDRDEDERKVEGADFPFPDFHSPPP
jgi:hypothetical protein